MHAFCRILFRVAFYWRLALQVSPPGGGSTGLAFGKSCWQWLTSVLPPFLCWEKITQWLYVKVTCIENSLLGSEEYLILYRHDCRTFFQRISIQSSHQEIEGA